MFSAAPPRNSGDQVRTTGGTKANSFQRVLLDQIVRDDALADQMLDDDPLEHRRIALAVPRSFRVDDRDRTTFADAQAVGLRPQNAALFGEVKFLQTALEKIPRRKAAILLAALGCGLIAAEENMSPRSGYPDAGGDLLLRFGQSAQAV